METNLQKRLLRDKQFGDKGVMLSKFKWNHSYQTSQKQRKAERIEEVVPIHVWLSGIKALPDTNSYF
jgi:hypothetical protein